MRAVSLITPAISIRRNFDKQIKLNKVEHILQHNRMANLPKRLTGDQSAIDDFIDKFDVRWYILRRTEAKTSLTCPSDLSI
jgi:hypothetical protein